MKGVSRVIAICTAVISICFVFLWALILLLFTWATIDWWGFLYIFAFVLIVLGVIVPLIVYYTLRGAGWALGKLMH